MRFVISMMKHETNTFSPVPTPLERFGDNGPYFGNDEVLKAFKGTKTPIGAYIDLALDKHIDFIAPVAAEAWPSGPVDDKAYELISDAICDALEKGCDALFLDLHGAMVSEKTDDGEGTLLARIRAIAPELPIALSLDLHANLTQKMVDNCTVIVGYKTYPHVDMYETGAKAGEILFDALEGRVNPVMEWGNRPLLPHTLCLGTDKPPMKDLVGMTKSAEAEGALAVTVFSGFPLADIHDARMSVVAVTDNDLKQARTISETVLNEVWERRTDFVYHSEPLEKSIARAKQLSEGPILLIDHADNCASGGTQDTMAVLAEVMRQDLENVAVAAIRDPDAVNELIHAGVGKKARIKLGGKMDMPSIGLKGEPLEVSGIVRIISDGEFTIEGPMFTGVKVYMGRTVVLDTGKIQILVIERNHEPWDLGVLTSVGIDPNRKKYILLKSRYHYRAGFLPIARHVIECDGIGVTSSNYSQFNFKKLLRPIYPLDLDAHA